MRILHVANHFAEYALRLSDALSARHQVLTVLNATNAASELVSPRGTGMWPGGGVLCLPDRRVIDPRWFLNTRAFSKAAREFRPDVIHLQDAPADYLMAAWPLLRQYPVALTIHDPVPHSGSAHLRRERIEKYSNWVRRRADAVIVHGEPALARAEERMPWLKGRTYSLLHGPLGQGADSRTVGKPDWQVGRILFFGRVEAYKGLSYLLDALEMLYAEGLRVSLCVAGTGSDLSRHRARVERMEWCTVVDRYIRATELAELFRQAHVVALPYTDASQSGVAAMALNFGRPIVATATGSVGDLVREDVNGFLVPPRDAGALAAALRRILGDPVLAAKFAANSRNLAETDVSWGRIAGATQTVYEAAIRNHRVNQESAKSGYPTV